MLVREYLRVMILTLFYVFSTLLLVIAVAALWAYSPKSIGIIMLYWFLSWAGQMMALYLAILSGLSAVISVLLVEQFEWLLLLNSVSFLLFLRVYRKGFSNTEQIDQVLSLIHI